jgi:carbonic anhydrase
MEPYERLLLANRGAEPGELFVRRNVANLVLETDVTLFAVCNNPWKY